MPRRVSRSVCRRDNAQWPTVSIHTERASYALLTMMIAQVTGLGVGDFVHTFGDVHLYNNHVEQAALQLSRAPRPLPTLRLDPSVTRLEDFTAEHVELIGYDPHPGIKAPVAV